MNGLTMQDAIRTDRQTETMQGLTMQAIRTEPNRFAIRHDVKTMQAIGLTMQAMDNRQQTISTMNAI